jgi:hypothetical protein
VWLKELGTIQAIAGELEKLAAGLRDFPQSNTSQRNEDPAQKILASLKTINATLAAGARRGSLGSDGFTTMGTEFERIGTTLKAIGSGSSGSGDR